MDLTAKKIIEVLSNSSNLKAREIAKIMTSRTLQAYFGYPVLVKGKTKIAPLFLWTIDKATAFVKVFKK